MARLAYHGGVQPSEFWAMAPEDSRQLDNALREIHEDDVELRVKLAQVRGG